MRCQVNRSELTETSARLAESGGKKPMSASSLSELGGSLFHERGENSAIEVRVPVFPPPRHDALRDQT